MYSYLLFVGSALIAAALIKRFSARLSADRGLLAIVLLIGICLGRIGGGIIYDLAPVEFRLESSHSLVSIRNAKVTTDIFVFGSGTIGEGMTYLVQVLHDDGSSTPVCLPDGQNVTITEDPNLSNQGTWKTYRKTVDNTWWLSGFAIASNRPADVLHELQVPPGSIAKEISFR